MNSSKQFLSRFSRGLKTTMPNFVKKNKNSAVAANTKKQRPEANVVGVDLKDVSREGVTLLTKISAHNPYVVPIPICDIIFTVKSGNRVVTSGRIRDPGFLKANDNTLMDAPVKVPYSALVSLVQDIRRDWDIDYVLELGLVVDVPIIGNITIPLSYKGVMKLPTFSDFLK